MSKNSKNNGLKHNQNLSDHLANERTYLAWVRTSIGIMAFGFVVEKFSIFIKQIAAFLGKAPLSGEINITSASQGYSSIFGVLLVAFGIVICLFAFLKFKKIERQIAEGSYHSSTRLDTVLTLSVLLTGAFLIVYLIHSI